MYCISFSLLIFILSVHVNDERICLAAEVILLIYAWSLDKQVSSRPTREVSVKE